MSYEKYSNDNFEESGGTRKETEKSVDSVQHPQAQRKRMLSKAMKVINKRSNKSLKKFKDIVKEDDDKREKKKITVLRTVMVSRLPEGFVEEDIHEYFEQFGEISRSVLVKSAKTGKSRHFAFIEFKNPEVARIAAETMNNYVVFKRLIKATLVQDPSDKLWVSKFYAPNNCPGYNRRMINAAGVNKSRSPVKEVFLRNRRVSKLKKKMTKLMDMGFDYMYLPRYAIMKKEEREAVNEYKREKKKQLKAKRVAALQAEKRQAKGDALSREARELGRRGLKAEKAIEKFKFKLATDISEYAEAKEVWNSSHNSLGSKWIMAVDKSDTEIQFKTPPNIIKRKIVKGSYPKFSL